MNSAMKEGENSIGAKNGITPKIFYFTCYFNSTESSVFQNEAIFVRLDE